MRNKPKRRQAPTRKPSPRSQPPPSSWGKRAAMGVGLLVVIIIVGAIALTPEPVRGVPVGTETVAVGEAAHVEGEIHDEGEVPAGGEHNPVWLNCGYYDSEVDPEFAVHSLEHGAVWITYNPNLGRDGIDRLRAMVRRDRKIIVSPVDGLEDPVLVTAWANQLHLDSADDDRIDQFVNEFSGSFNAPEPGGSCQGGVGSPSF